MVAVLLVTAGCRHPDTVSPPASPLTKAPAALAREDGVAPHGRTARDHGLGVLRSWDARRAEAYSAGDVAALRRLHVPGSLLARQDVAVLRRYRERGLRVTRLEQQVFSVDVHEAGARAVTMTVVERLARTSVRRSERRQGGSGQWVLPASGFERRTLRFEREAAGWRLSWARAG